MIIDWQKKEGIVIANPQHALKKPSPIDRSIILCTTGSILPKWVILSYDSFLVSAEAVNKHLDVTLNDRWLISLPLFHVGGLSILARACLGNNRVKFLSQKWSVEAFIKECEGSTLTSLVPTQLFDLVHAEKRPPSSLRGVVIGGDRLDQTLFKKARDLGWPLYQSYGMTEACSQIATTRLNETKLLPLSHIQLKTEEGFIAVKSDALMTGYIEEGIFTDPKKEGWFVSSDKGEIEPELKIFGREQVIKVKGELVSLSEIEKKLVDLKDRLANTSRMVLLPVKDARLGQKLTLFHDDPNIKSFLTSFNEGMPGVQKICRHVYVKEFPLNSVGKICRKSLMEGYLES